jgi:hypothetical protein
MHFYGYFWVQWSIYLLKCWTFAHLMKITQTQSEIANFFEQNHWKWTIVYSSKLRHYEKQTMIHNTIWLITNHFEIFDIRG